jgi:signal transduction histidine kinase
VGQVSHELLKTRFPVPLQQIDGELLESEEWNGALTHSTRDGREITVASHWALVRDDAGEPISVIEVNNDITAVKATEVALRRAKQEAEENSRAKSRLLAAVGHDLRQPLTVIRMVLSGLEGKVGSAEQQNLARADRSSEYLASALDTLLEASQLESGAIEPRVTTFPISTLLDAIREEFALIAGEKGLNFHVMSCDACVHSDAKMLGSILRNLVSNAICYTEQGTVAVACEVHDSTLSVQVRDTGIGIPEDKMDLIFEEFQRIDPSKGAGLGLGLAIVRRAAEALGHAVSVRSTLNTGSEFRIDVPAAA